MLGTAHDSAATRTLKGLHAEGRTGRVSLGVGAAEISVWLLDGHLVAARAGDDTRTLIDRLGRNGHLAPSRARQLQGMVNTAPSGSRLLVHDPILALLADEIDSDVLDRALKDRFFENICRFVGGTSTPAFEAEVAPWAENIQIGHDTGRLIERCALDFDLAAGLDERRQMVAGPARPESPEERQAQTLAARNRVTVGEVVAALDMEPIAARVAVIRMLDRGVLSDPPTEPVRRGGGWDSSEVASRRNLTSGPREAFLRSAEEPAPRFPGADRVAPRPPEPVVDDELSAFSGELDQQRGTGGAGTFVADRAHLDRVEIVDLGGDAPATAPTEGAYGAPTLTERDAQAKIDVANEVLGTLCRAIDHARGATRGAAAIQLLVDARPRAFAAVFEGLKVSPTGSLPSRALLSNLRRRPAAEQRRLLNDCLLDLLDRALDKGSDELPEDAFDRVLEKVMGYRQRLGL